jgi:DNA recombination protein RmuC
VIVVDAKFPGEAFFAHLEASTDSDRRLLLARHAKQTREHVAKLAAKGYQRQFDTPAELVVMFVPSDGIYQSALAEDPELIEYGVHQHVLMATPTTLIALLRAVHYGWRQEQVAQSAREIADSARELHSRLGRFIEPLARVGRQLDSAAAAYNEAVGSFDRRVVPQVRRIEQAGASSGREVLAPPAVETTARPVTARLEPEQGAGTPQPVPDSVPEPIEPGEPLAEVRTINGRDSEVAAVNRRENQVRAS